MPRGKARRFHRGGAVDYKGKHYPDFEAATGYGTGAGLCGWNCRHTFFAVFPELGDPPQWTQEQLRELNARNIEWNGKKYTAYEISQMQRARERNVRRWKKRYLAEDAAGLDTTDSRCAPESGPPEPCRVCTGHGWPCGQRPRQRAQVRQERSQQGKRTGTEGILYIQQLEHKGKTCYNAVNRKC